MSGDDRESKKMTHQTEIFKKVHERGITSEAAGVIKSEELPLSFSNDVLEQCVH